MKLVFATNNEHKLSEIRSILRDKVEIVSLRDIGCHDDIPETGHTLEENAVQKAMYIYDKYSMNVFADDTGLEVEALGGAPGVYSARYAGDKHDSNANMDKLLRALKEKDNRNARFRTVIALLLIDGHSTQPRRITFEGAVNGTITKERAGTAGFGYDPVFLPDGYDKTFAELGENIKNNISHRALAVRKLADYLNNILP